MNQSFKCKIGLHDWEKLGMEDQLFHGKHIPFFWGLMIHVCKRCLLFKGFSPSKGDVRFRIEDLKKLPKQRINKILIEKEIIAK